VGRGNLTPFHVINLVFTRPGLYPTFCKQLSLQACLQFGIVVASTHRKLVSHTTEDNRACVRWSVHTIDTRPGLLDRLIVLLDTSCWAIVASRHLHQEAKMHVQILNILQTTLCARIYIKIISIIYRSSSSSFNVTVSNLGSTSNR
jgi:hypothetical protein